MTHYVYGSGSFGCLYDNGPNFSESENDAIEDLTSLFEDSLSEEEYEEMRENLRNFGIHHFQIPSEAGADYAEVKEQNGEMPVCEDM